MASDDTKDIGKAAESGEHPLDEWNERKLHRLAEWICAAKTIVWFTGAGISTESGLPDYRGPNGVRTRARKGLPHPAVKKPRDQIEPNAAHRAIVEFERLGKCDFLISQNVDNLHLKSGFPFEKLAELHGNSDRLRCRACDKTFPAADFPPARGEGKRGKAKHVSDLCPDCGSCLQSSVINFGDKMPWRDLVNSFDWAQRSDLMIVVGSSCKVIPAADIPRRAKEAGARLAIVNIGKTDLEDLCDLRFDDIKAGRLLTRLLVIVQKTLPEKAAGETTN